MCKRKIEVLSKKCSACRLPEAAWRALAQQARFTEQAAAKETEGMTPDEVVAHSDRAAVRRRFDAALRRAGQAGKAKGERWK